MPPGKKTKKTLACVVAGANVLGTRKRDNRSVLIYGIYIEYLVCGVGVGGGGVCVCARVCGCACV